MKNKTKNVILFFKRVYFKNFNVIIDSKYSNMLTLDINVLNHIEAI